MLYDPKWAKPDLMSNEGFIRWLEQQPADGTYVYMSCHCAIGEYLEAHGSSYSEKLKGGWQKMTDWNRRVTAPMPRTYGAALERARKAYNVI